MPDIPTINTPPSIQDLSKKANAIYNALDSEFIENNKGKYIALDIDSGEHFVAETRDESVKEAHKKHPGKIIFVRRIGTLEKVSRHFSSLKNQYGRIL